MPTPRTGRLNGRRRTARRTELKTYKDGTMDEQELRWRAMFAKEEGWEG